jgi:hypothetical protein
MRQQGASRRCQHPLLQPASRVRPQLQAAQHGVWLPGWRALEPPPALP